MRPTRGPRGPARSPLARVFPGLIAAVL